LSFGSLKFTLRLFLRHWSFQSSPVPITVPRSLRHEPSSPGRTLGPSPTQGINVCMRLFSLYVVLCV
jgi:hypothetical protein